MLNQLKKTFGSNEPNKVLQSREFSLICIRERKEWQAFLSRSNSQVIMVFKHSTLCDISDAALQEFKAFAAGNDFLAYGIVDVIEDRWLSNEIASEMGIRHESPQIIMIQDSRVVWHASHSSITADQLRQAIDS